MENLPKDMQDIWEPFGLNATSYYKIHVYRYIHLYNNIDFLINNKTGKFNGFAFIKDPADVKEELAKLDGIIYHDNDLRLKTLLQLKKNQKRHFQ